MSTVLKTLKQTGSRGVELSLVRYSGGKNGICLQIAGPMEDGRTGYVQLNKKDIVDLVKIWDDAKDVTK